MSATGFRLVLICAVAGWQTPHYAEWRGEVGDRLSSMRLAIQASISDSTQPTLLSPKLMGGGNLPSAIRR